MQRLAALPPGKVQTLDASDGGATFKQLLGPDVAVRLYTHPSGNYVEAALLFKAAGAVALADLAFGSFADEGMRLAPLRWFGQVRSKGRRAAAAGGIW